MKYMMTGGNFTNNFETHHVRGDLVAPHPQGASRKRPYADAEGDAYQVEPGPHRRWPKNFQGAQNLSRYPLVLPHMCATIHMEESWWSLAGFNIFQVKFHQEIDFWRYFEQFWAFLAFFFIFEQNRRLWRMALFEENALWRFFLFKRCSRWKRYSKTVNKRPEFHHFCAYGHQQQRLGWWLLREPILQKYRVFCLEPKITR